MRGGIQYIGTFDKVHASNDIDTHVDNLLLNPSSPCSMFFSFPSDGLLAISY